jgi:carbamoyl-phosphate synthase small subunit
VRLSDGTTFNGLTKDSTILDCIGEVVFTTGMTGYELSLTDPSYADQILMFTYPLIGNYGVPPEDTWESDRIYARGVIVSEACRAWSHSGSLGSLQAWLDQQGVPLLMDVDTRALTKHLRTKGSMVGCLETNGSKTKLPRRIATPHVSINEPKIYNPRHQKTLIVVDCGMKLNILRMLRRLPMRIKRVPYDYDYTTEDYAGVFISNGPGDPVDYAATIVTLKKAMRTNKPIFGICLGSQLMALAAGAHTYKLPFGHRSHNQPCIEEKTGRCFITSQNHGYAVDGDSLPRGWYVSFRNLNDNSVEGIAHRTKPFFSVQFHPEANPGPVDTEWLFTTFGAML